jgi:hypothetical protein
MFVCAVCVKSVGPAIGPTRIVIETRAKTYPARPHANDPGGRGIEVVREVLVCPACIEVAKEAACK